MLLVLFSQAVQYYLDPVVVVGTPIDSVPYVVETYGEEDVEDVQDIGEYLRENTATPLSYYGFPGSISTAALDGISATHTQVMLNGISVNDPFNGTFDLSLIPASSTGKLELARGALSSLGGRSGMGGVVNVALRKKERVRAKLLTGGRERIHTKYLSFKSAWKLEEQFFGLDGTAVIDSGYRENTGMRGAGVHGVIEFSPVEIHALYSWKKRGSPPSLEAWMENSFLMCDAVVREKNLFLHPYIIHSRLYSHGDWFDEEYVSTRMGVKGGIRIDDVKLSGEVSLDTVESKTLMSDEESPIYKGMEKKAEGFIEYSTLLGPVVLFFNGRLAYSSLYELNHSFSSGIVLYPLEGLKTGISIGKGYRNPTLCELYYPGFGNTELEPEEAWFYSVSLEKWGFSLSFVEMHAKRLIVYREVEPYVLKPYNVDSVRVRSIFLNGRKKIGPVEAGLSFRFSDRNDNFPGMEYRAFLMGKYGLLEGGIRLTGAYQRKDLEPYTTLDAWTKIGWEMFEIVLRGENLLGEEYETFPSYPAPPGPRWSLELGMR